MQVTVTRTEGEALLLENNLIKELKPRYNVLLRDDKSYPYIYVSDHAGLPAHRLLPRRPQGPGRYFGPYPSAGAVRESLGLLQKLFRVRQCEDSFFRNRTRPCLQYQIKRCTAPCVGYIDKEAYQADMNHAIMFLEGRNREVMSELGARMEAAAAALDYERAARYRDQIARLQRIQEKQYVSGEAGDMDIIASVARNGGWAACRCSTSAAGATWATRASFPARRRTPRPPRSWPRSCPSTTWARRFLPEIIVGSRLDVGRCWRRPSPNGRGGVSLSSPRSAADAPVGWRWRAPTPCSALDPAPASQAGYTQRLELCRRPWAWKNLPQRLECFDISHTGGGATVASCVVFDGGAPASPTTGASISRASRPGTTMGPCARL